MTPTTATPVDLARIVDAMAAHGVELAAAEGSPAAMANLNDRQVTFAALGSVAIVRVDSLTDSPAEEHNAALYLAANHLNSIQMEACTTIVDYAEKLIIRTEHEIPTAGGLTDAQLAAALKTAVDGVLKIHDAFGVTAEQFGTAAN